MSLDKSSASVRAMFSGIAWRYDLLNHLLSANLDKLWRRRAVRRLGVRQNQKVLDLCCGTGDLGLEIAQQQPNCHILGADFAVPMLQLAQQKTRGRKVETRVVQVAADALQLPFPDNYFHVVTVGFGVRNFEDTRAGLQEILRVLQPGGKVLVLEFMRPGSATLRWFFGLFNVAMAPVGRLLSGHASAYNYLPQSIDGFCSVAEFGALMREVGWQDVRSWQHSLGIATSFIATKPA